MRQQPLTEPILCFRDALGLAMQIHNEQIESQTVDDQTGIQVYANSRGQPLGQAAQALPEMRSANHGFKNEQHEAAIGVALLDSGGKCIDLGLFRNTSVESAGGWAIGICRGVSNSANPVAKVVLISVATTTPRTIHESDLELFRSIRSGLVLVGAELVDWIETDGDHVRSFAYLTCPASAWPSSVDN